MAAPGDNAERARQELQRVLASGILASSPRQARLLQHIVERSLRGERESLKEYSLGLDVFDRDASFDPKIDSVVRGTARQLRLKLAEYYQGEGQANPVRIHLPRGSYVAAIEERPAAPPAPDRVRPTGAWLIAGAALALAIAAIALLAGSWNPLRANRPRTVAVLALRDYSNRQDLAYFAEGLHDGLTSALVHTKGLDVTARVSSAALDGGQKSGPSLVEIARSLGADSVVWGSISPSGDRFQLVLALVDGKSARYLWSHTYDGTPADLAAIEGSAASGIARALGVSAETPAPRVPRGSEALELYLRACSLARVRHPEETREAARLFERTIVLDPDFAPAYAAAASNYLVAVWNGVLHWDPEGKRGMELAGQAVALDPALPEGHLALAQGWQAQWNWRDADREIARAIELDPRYPRAYFHRAFDLVILRRFAQAERAIETARTLDPSWFAPKGLLAELYYYEHRYGEAHALARRERPADPAFFNNFEARIYDVEGRPDLARPLHAACSNPLDRAELRAIDGDPGGAYRDLGRSGSAVSDYERASFAVLYLHDRAAAVRLLQQSLRHRDPDLVSLALDPIFDPIRQEAAVAAVLHDLNLAE